MKLRESGMPDEEYWESLFDVGLTLDRLGIDETVGDVVELGCGYGTFTLDIARRISGSIATFDVDTAMVRRTLERAADERIGNLLCEVRDVSERGFALSGQDGCLLFNILHCEEPVRLLDIAADALHPGGLVYIIHWRRDDATPRGPTMAIRPSAEDILGWAEQTGRLAPRGGILDLPPWHFGLRFVRFADVGSLLSSAAPNSQTPGP